MNYNKELLNRFLTKKVAIALRIQEEWNMFMELLEKETDLKWVSGKKPTELGGWDIFKENTQIGIENGFIYYGIFHFIVNGYEIIEFKELAKEKEMNLADKLRFLADRWEDGKDFYIGRGKYSLNSGKLVVIPSGIDGEIEINDLKGLNLKLAPQWTFTEDEKVILRNLPEEFTWIARHKSGHLTIHEYKPVKHNNGINWLDFEKHDSLSSFKHIFQSVQWSDEEPCEFREYL